MNQADLLKRTRAVDDCLEWTGSFVHHSHPVFSQAGKKVYTKRHLMELAGHNLAGMCVVSKCGNASCVNPKHLEVVTKAEVIKRTAASGAFSTLAVRAKVAEGKRRNSKLSQDAVRELMTSTEPVSLVTTRLGITEAYGHMIRKGRFRKEYSNPFAGLLK